MELELDPSPGSDSGNVASMPTGPIGTATDVAATESTQSTPTTVNGDLPLPASEAGSSTPTSDYGQGASADGENQLEPNRRISLSSVSISTTKTTSRKSDSDDSDNDDMESDC